MKIILDAGHGGDDFGAVASDVKEKDLNLAICKKLGILLRGAGYDILMTRNSDDFVSLHERAKKCNDSNANLMISIHCNAATNTEAKGAETIYYPTSKNGKKCAVEILENIEDITGCKHRSAYADRRGLYLLRATKCPAIIVETGFLSSSIELKMLQNMLYQWKVAIGIYEGIKEIRNGL